MEAFGTRMRGGVATLLSAALILSGALLAAPAASAEEPVAQTPVAEVAQADTIADVPAADTPLAVTTEQAPAEARPTDAPAAASLASAELVSPAVAAAPSISNTVAITPDTKVDVTVTGAGFEDVKTLPGQTSPHVYLALIEKGTDLSTFGQSTDVPNITADVVEGAISGTLTQLATKLDRTKSYEVISWPSRSTPSDATLYARVDVAIDWATLFPAPVVAGTATVTSASEAGLTVTGQISGVDPASQPNGVHLGVVLRGTAIGATQPSFLGATASVKTIPASGEFAADVVIPAAKLDRTKQYELVVWPRYTNPVESNVVKVIPFDVTTEQWSAVFPPAGPSVTFSDTSELDPAGATVTVSGTGFDTTTNAADYYKAPDLKAGVYVQIGWVDGNWAPSAGGKNKVNRLGVLTDWVSNMAPAPSRWTDEATGSFTATFTGVTLDELQKAKPAGMTENARLAVFTSVAGGAPAQAKYEFIQDLAFAQAPTGPQIVGSVTGASPDGLKVSATLDNVVIPTGKFGAYVGVIEKDRVAEYGSDAGAGMVEHYFRTSDFVDGSASVELTVPKVKLDRKSGDAIRSLDPTKQYVLVSWLAHGYLSDESKLAQHDLVVSSHQWGAVFPAKTNITATSTVTTDGLKVAVNATGLPGNIYAALIERGTAGSIDMSKPDSYAAFALPFPEVTDGVANFSLTAPMAKLDRKKQYEVLVWQQHSAPDATTTYGQADVTVTEAQWDELQGIKPPVVVPPVKPQPTVPGAGSLTWGISSSFANYVTGTIAKGSISTNGVGGGRGGYVFPQATGSSWNADTRTGTVRYSGTVTFTGHGGLLSETFSNPVITVSSPTSGTISAGGQSFPLNLTGAGFTANADGSATWSGVSVGGAISGGDGGGAGGSLGMDSLSFTVGSASALNFGSTSTVSQFAKKREAAATAPASTGLTVVTPTAKLVAGGEIEITAGGFQPNEQGILVVIYSEPTVLDTNAKADANGVVRWIGTLPKDLAGKHTITLQGSVNVGQEITIAKAGEVKKKNTTVAAETSAPAVQAAAAGETSGVPAWAWWTGALALLVIAGAGTALVVAQRRKVDAPTHL